MSQHALQSTARRLAVGKPLPTISLMRAALPATSLANKRFAAIDTSQTTTATPSEGMTILENQRLRRPVSPHLQIYKPQVTWTLSALNRITGCTLSGTMYLFGAAYALLPIVGISISSAGLAAGFAKWPFIAKVGVKAFYAAPFVFHSVNGIRHLMWDWGWGLTNQAVIKSGWVTLGLTGIGTLALLFM